MFEVKSVFLIPTGRVAHFLESVFAGFRGYDVNTSVTVRDEIAEVCIRKVFQEKRAFLAFYEQFQATAQALLRLDYVSTPPQSP